MVILPTIKDVAKRANVSVATVSRVLNNTGYVNIETRHLVEQAIKDLGYIPNELARSLFRKKSNIIGLIVPHISTHFFAQLIESIEDAVTKEGYKLMIFNSKDDDVIERHNLSFMNQYNIDGLILVANTKSANEYLKFNIPILTIDHIMNDDVPSITSDNVEGGRLAARKLLDGGARKLIHFRGPSPLITVIERSKGFYDELSTTRHVTVTSYDLDFKNPDKEAIRKFILEHPDVDGIFCSSDWIAIYVMHVLNELNYKIPDDVQVIGFDNIELASVTIPTLTTIAQPIKDFGVAAVKTLMKLMKKEKPDHFHQILPVHLIERNSTKKGV